LFVILLSGQLLSLIVMQLAIVTGISLVQYVVETKAHTSLLVMLDVKISP